MLPEGFTLVHIGNVHLDDRTTAGAQGIEDRDRRVGEGRRIDDDAVDIAVSLLDHVDNGALAVGLEELNVDTGSNRGGTRRLTSRRYPGMGFGKFFARRLDELSIVSY